MNTGNFDIPFYHLGSTGVAPGRLTGNNARGLLVLVNAGDIPTHMPLLQKIIRAIGYDFEQDMAFAAVAADAQMQLLAGDFAEYHHLMTFGLLQENLGIQAQKQVGIIGADDASIKPALFNYEKLTVLVSPSLADLEQKPELKRQLWSYLKTTFQS